MITIWIIYKCMVLFFWIWSYIQFEMFESIIIWTIKIIVATPFVVGVFFVLSKVVVFGSNYTSKENVSQRDNYFLRDRMFMNRICKKQFRKTWKCFYKWR